jgi:hypothetical protein
MAMGLTKLTASRLPPWWSRRRRPKTKRCERCKAKIKVKGRGRVPRFCSPTCRQLAYEQRKWQRPAPVVLAAQDIATIHVRDFIRAEIWSLLQAAARVGGHAMVAMTLFLGLDQTAGDRTERGDTDCQGGRTKPLKIHTQRYDHQLGGTRVADFQDRCLKPLGHPSTKVMSIT